MNIDKFKRLDITLMGDVEIAAFENIVSLAIRQLQASPVENLNGTPLSAQAGLKGKDLIDAKQMLERFADKFGWDTPALEPSADSDDVPPEIAELVELLQATGADVRITKLAL